MVGRVNRRNPGAFIMVFALIGMIVLPICMYFVWRRSGNGATRRCNWREDRSRGTRRCVTCGAVASLDDYPVPPNFCFARQKQG